MTKGERGEELKEIMRRYPTGVTVVTSLLDGEPSGGTMNSFTSVSLNPPLIALFITIGSRTSDAILQTGRFVVNILKEGQEDFAMGFADDKSESKFQGVRYHGNSHGIPVLDDSLGYIECDLHMKDEIADHYLFVGEVTGASVLNDDHALVYHRRGFGSTQSLSPRT